MGNPPDTTFCPKIFPGKSPLSVGSPLDTIFSAQIPKEITSVSGSPVDTTFYPQNILGSPLLSVGTPQNTTFSPQNILGNPL